ESFAYLKRWASAGPNLAPATEGLMRKRRIPISLEPASQRLPRRSRAPLRRSLRRGKRGGRAREVFSQLGLRREGGRRRERGAGARARPPARHGLQRAHPLLRHILVQVPARPQA